MDGPLSFDVSLSNGEFVLKCQRRRQHATQVVLEGRVPSAVFMEGLVAAARQVVKACEHQGWKSKDLERLKNIVMVARSG